METLFRFIVRTDVGFALIVMALLIWANQGFGAALGFFAFWAVVRWFCRTAIGKSLPERSLEERQEEVAHVVQNHVQQGARSTPSNLDPAWRRWLNSAPPEH